MQAKGAAKDVGKNLNPSSSNLPNPSAAADKAAGNAKGLAADAKQGAKNVASDLSENPLDGLADKVRRLLQLQVVIFSASLFLWTALLHPCLPCLQ